MSNVTYCIENGIRAESRPTGSVHIAYLNQCTADHGVAYSCFIVGFDNIISVVSLYTVTINMRYSCSVHSNNNDSVCSFTGSEGGVGTCQFPRHVKPYFYPSDDCVLTMCMFSSGVDN